MRWIGAVAVLAAFAVAVPDIAWAHGRGGARSGARAGSGQRHTHRHHSFSGAFVFWSPWWYRGGYAYAPMYTPTAPYPEPPVYVERFSGEPTPGTTERIFCPNRGAYYPDATECPGGWQRVID